MDYMSNDNEESDWYTNTPEAAAHPYRLLDHARANHRHTIALAPALDRLPMQPPHASAPETERPYVLLRAANAKSLWYIGDTQGILDHTPFRGGMGFAITLRVVQPEPRLPARLHQDTSYHGVPPMEDKQTIWYIHAIGCLHVGWRYMWNICCLHIHIWYMLQSQEGHIKNFNQYNKYEQRLR